MKNKERERTNKILQTIANILYLNRHRIKDVGLLNGKMGTAIYLYHYARYSGHNIYEEFADDFMDDILNNKMNEVRHPNFFGGISGLAWGFNYLIENKFIETEDNTVLDDLEAFLVKSISPKSTTSETENIDLLGVGLYYMSKWNRKLAIENDDIATVDFLLTKCRIIIDENESKPVFDIKYFNFLLYLLTEIAKMRIKGKNVLGLLSVIGDMLLKQTDCSSHNTEDIYILQKNIEQVQQLVPLENKWNQLKIKLSNKTLSEFNYFNWQTFIYFSFNDLHISDFLLDEIDAFIEQKLNNLQNADFVLGDRLLSIGIGLLRNT